MLQRTLVRGGSDSGTGAAAKHGRTTNSDVSHVEMERLDKLMKAELAVVMNRRRRLGLPVESCRQTTSQPPPLRASNHLKDQALLDVRDLDNTFGICFSGGGIRSAAFSSGVLSALATSGWLKHVDYMSCVSGGSATAASFASHAARRASGAPQGGDPSEDLVSSAEKSHRQLRSNCDSPLSRGNAVEIALYLLQIAGVLVTSLVTAPLAALCGSIIFSRTIDSVMGDYLRDLLEKGLVESHWTQINGFLVFFGPLTAATCCMSFSHLQRRYTTDLKQLHKGGSVFSPAGQIARIISSILLSIDAVIIIMFLDERLFRGTAADEAVQVGLACVWVYAVFALALGPGRVDKRHDSMLASLWSLMTISLLWLSARICVLRVTGRLQGMLADECAWIGSVVLLVINDYVSRSAHPLLRQRLRIAFLHSNRQAASQQDSCLLMPPPRPPMAGTWPGSGSGSWQYLDMLPRPHAIPPAASLGDIYYGLRSAAPAPSCPPFLPHSPRSASVLWRAHGPAGCVDEDANSGDPPLGELVGDAGMPYLLINVASSGHVRRRALPSKGAQVWDDKGCPFVLSPMFCGSERTGYFRTPSSLSLSSALAMCCSSNPFSAASSDDCEGVRERFLRHALSTGDWLPISPTLPSLQAGGCQTALMPIGGDGVQSRGASGASGASASVSQDTMNPIPNFCLDPSGSVPVSRPPTRASLGLSHCPPWLAKALVPLLALCTILSLAEPAFFLVPVGMGLAALLFSFLPEGRALLLSPQLRGIHRVLGTVHSSDLPPPFLHLSDGSATDRLGLVELLRRRCSTIFVCDATADPDGEFSDLSHAIECARRELGCAFLPPKGTVRGDIATAMRDFQADPTARCLRLGVEYFARPAMVHSSPVLGAWRIPFARFAGAAWLPDDLVKSGDIWVLKCRATSLDKDLPLPRSSAIGGSSTAPCGSLAGACLPGVGKGVGQRDWYQTLVRRVGNIWRTSCVDADPPMRSEPDQHFLTSQSFNHYSALGARSAWAALEGILLESEGVNTLPVHGTPSASTLSPGQDHLASWHQDTGV